MTTFLHQYSDEIIYPSSDGEPMAESDPARDYLIYGVEALDIYFQDCADVYVSGNLFIYYRQGVPSAVVAPDVFVVFGVPKRQRLSYKVWEEEGVVPSFVLEITSRTTQGVDEEEKPDKYARLGVLEYFQYDPSGHYLTPHHLKGSRLVEGRYRPLPGTVLPEGVFSIHSQTLGLDLRVQDGALRFYDPRTGKKLLSPKEMNVARQQAEQARLQAEQARLQAEQAQRDAVPRLQKLGLTIEQVAEVLGLSQEDVRAFWQEDEP